MISISPQNTMRSCFLILIMLAVSHISFGADLSQGTKPDIKKTPEIYGKLKEELYNFEDFDTPVKGLHESIQVTDKNDLSKIAVLDVPNALGAAQQKEYALPMQFSSQLRYIEEHDFGRRCSFGILVLLNTYAKNKAFDVHKELLKNLKRIVKDGKVQFTQGLISLDEVNLFDGIPVDIKDIDQAQSSVDFVNKYCLRNLPLLMKKIKAVSGTDLDPNAKKSLLIAYRDLSRINSLIVEQQIDKKTAENIVKIDKKIDAMKTTYPFGSPTHNGKLTDDYTLEIVIPNLEESHKKEGHKKESHRTRLVNLIQRNLGGGAIPKRPTVSTTASVPIVSIEERADKPLNINPMDIKAKGVGSGLISPTLAPTPMVQEKEREELRKQVIDLIQRASENNKKLEGQDFNRLTSILLNDYLSLTPDEDNELQEIFKNSTDQSSLNKLLKQRSGSSTIPTTSTSTSSSASATTSTTTKELTITPTPVSIPPVTSSFTTGVPSSATTPTTSSSPAPTPTLTSAQTPSTSTSTTTSASSLKKPVTSMPPPTRIPTGFFGGFGAMFKFVFNKIGNFFSTIFSFFASRR